MIGSGFERRDSTADGGGGGGARMRVYELAKELKMEHKDLVNKIRAMGIEVANHMSHLEASEADRIRRALDRERHETLVEQRLSDTVIRRRSRVPAAAPAAPAAAAPPAAPVAARPAAPATRAPAPEVVAKPAAPAPVVPKAEPIVEAPSAPVAPTATEAKPAVVAEAKASEEKAKTAEKPAEKAAKAPKAKEEAAAPAVAAPPAPIAPPAVAAPAAPVAEAAPVVAKPVEKPIVAEPVAAAAPPPVPRPAPAVVNRPVMVDVPRATPGGAITTGPRGPGNFSGQPASLTGDNRPPLKTIVQPVITGSAATGAFIQLPGHPPRGQAGMQQPQQPGVPRVEITNRDEELRRLGRAGLMARGTTSGDRFGRGPTQPGQRPGGPPRKKMVAAGKKVKQTQITTPAEHKRVVRMDTAIAVSDLAQRMGVKGNEIIKKLWGLGMMGVTINQNIDLDTAGLIAQEFGYQVESTAFREEEVISEESEENPEDLVPRAPVVTVMGHVDHGKTSLLDVIRKANVASGEAGGITQHIGAYKVHTPGGDVVFLDTPGHEAFTAMRARGAKMTDIVVLVVAADDGPMPQTIEAINHARAAEVPIVVAVNKVDKPGANPAAIRTKLMEHNLVAEEFGGDIIFVDVSAKTKQGVDKLLEMLALQAEVLELHANPKKAARGHVVEARLDRSRGAISTVLVEEGTLRVGDLMVSGEVSGKIRAMLGDKGQPISEAGPSTPVEVLGLDGVSDAGELFNVVTDEKAAKSLVEHRRDQRRKKEATASPSGRVSLENILDKIREGEVKEVKIVLKADVQGSVEAIAQALRALSTQSVGVNVISSGVGGITESDVQLAKASAAVVIGFNVRPAGKSQQMSENEGVEIKLYQVIYDAIDDVKKAMVGMLAPVTREKALGKVEIRQVFNITKFGTIAGSFVTEGKINRKAQIRLVRDSVVVFTGKLGSLKRFKDDASEVAQGYECGLSIEGYQDLKVGDIIEAFEVESVAATLGAPITAGTPGRGERDRDRNNDRNDRNERGGR
jgi:translation initiation factor IF-2